jgi:hypothetical protein
MAINISMEDKFDSQPGEYYCVMPWHGAFYTSNGMGACCSWGDLEKATPMQFLKGDSLKRVKTQMLKGIVPKECNYCHEQEQNGFYSTRNLYRDHVKSKGWFEPSRSLEFKTPEVLEVRFSNLCNMQCRICSPDWSHLIGREVQESNNNTLKKFYEISSKKITDDPLSEIPDESVQEIIELAKKANHVFITGGEPTIHKQTIKLIDTLIEHGCAKNQTLHINTNCSAINPHLLKKFSEFDNIILSISIDGTGDVANYQRYGTKWDVVDANVRTLGEFKNKSPVIFGDDVTHSIIHTVSLGVNLAVSAYTVLDLDTTIKYLIDIWDHCKLSIGVSVVHYPFNPILLRGECRRLAVKKVQAAIDLIQDKIAQEPRFALYIKNSANSLEELQKLQQTLSQPEDPSLEAVRYYNNFIYKPTLALDEVRNQSFEQLFGLPLDPPVLPE